MVGCQRAAELIQVLDLQPHPEGGYFREVFRSARRVLYKNSGEERSALTTIYFLLVAGQHSQWHRIAADEVWHYCDVSNGCSRPGYRGLISRQVSLP